MRTRSVKDPGVADVSDAAVGRRTKPLERAEREFDMKTLLDKCGDWQQVQKLVEESPHTFEKDHEVCCAALLKASELMGPKKVLKKKGTARAGAKSLVDQLAVLLLPRMHKLSGPQVCGLVLSLKRLGYAPSKLMKSIFYYMSEKERLDVAIARSAAAPASDDPSKRKKLKTSFTISERFALLAAFAQMGVRPPPETVSRALFNSFSFLKYITAPDVCNLAQALHAWRAVVRQAFIGRLMFEGRDHFASMDPSSLVSLLYMLATAGYKSSSFHATALMRILEPSLSSLPSPSLYPTLMLALLRLRISVPPDAFDAMCCALLAPPAAMPAAAKRGASSAAAGAAATQLQRLSGQQLVVVLGVLGAQTKYTPERELLDALTSCLQQRCCDLSPEEAAAAVRVLPAALASDEDARQDAADLVDELLALVEGGLKDLTSNQLLGLAKALRQLGHVPDQLWADAFRAEVVGRVTVAAAVEEGAMRKVGRPGLVALVAALVELPAEEGAVGGGGKGARVQEPRALVEAVAEAGRRLGGFSLAQVLELSKSLPAVMGAAEGGEGEGEEGEEGAEAQQRRWQRLGLELPAAADDDKALDVELDGAEGEDRKEVLEGVPEAAVVPIFGGKPAPGDAAALEGQARAAGEGGEQEGQAVAENLLGFAPAGRDIRRMMKALARAEREAEYAAQRAEEGKRRAEAWAARGWGGGQGTRGLGGGSGGLGGAWAGEGEVGQWVGQEEGVREDGWLDFGQSLGGGQGRAAQGWGERRGGGYGGAWGGGSGARSQGGRQQQQQWQEDVGGGADWGGEWVDGVEGFAGDGTQQQQQQQWGGQGQWGGQEQWGEAAPWGDDVGTAPPQRQAWGGGWRDQQQQQQGWGWGGEDAGEGRAAGRGARRPAKQSGGYANEEAAWGQVGEQGAFREAGGYGESGFPAESGGFGEEAGAAGAWGAESGYQDQGYGGGYADRPRGRRERGGGYGRSGARGGGGASGGYYGAQDDEGTWGGVEENPLFGGGGDDEWFSAAAAKQQQQQPWGGDTRGGFDSPFDPYERQEQGSRRGGDWGAGAGQEEGRSDGAPAADGSGDDAAEAPRSRAREGGAAEGGEGSEGGEEPPVVIRSTRAGRGRGRPRRGA